MMFDFMGWEEAARLIEDSMELTIQKKTVTYDFERLMEGAKKVSTSGFANLIIGKMEHHGAHAETNHHSAAAHE
jgi:isocitrate dehydrogenase